MKYSESLRFHVSLDQYFKIQHLVFNWTRGKIKISGLYHDPIYMLSMDCDSKITGIQRERIVAYIQGVKDTLLSF